MTVQAVQVLAAPGLGGVAETAFAPLVARALAAEIAPDFGFRDRTAEAIYRSLQPELAPHRGPRPAMLAMIATTWVIDQIVGSFTSRHPHAQIVDLGAGLSTRFQRIDNGMLTWIDVDLPDIVTLRETLFPFCDRRRMVGVDVGSTDWIERLDLRRAPTLVVAEGLFAYATPATMTTVLADLAAATGRRTELLFDFTNRLLARRLSLRASGTAAGGQMRRGVRRHRDLVRDGWELLRIHPVYEAMGLPYSLLGLALRKATRCCPHGVAHLVCTSGPNGARSDDTAESAAPSPPADAPAASAALPGAAAVDGRPHPRPSRALR